jgi:hypothetical protein
MSREKTAVPRHPKRLSRIVPKFSEYDSKPSRDGADSPKTACPEISSSQIERIAAHFAMVKSKREVMRLEAATPGTVDPVVESKDPETHVREMRAKFFSLGDDAVLTLQAAAREGDSRLAFDILRSIGVIPARSDANAALVQLSPVEPDEQADVDKMLVRLLKTAAERAATFRTRCPEMDADLEKVGGRINYETGTFECVPEKS